jgi:hypothetical protein
MRRSVNPGLYRPGGVFLMADIAAPSHLERNLDNPLVPMLFTMSTMRCTTVSLAAGGEGRGACWGVEQAHELLSAAGLGSVETVGVDRDPINVCLRCRRCARATSS